MELTSMRQKRNATVISQDIMLTPMTVGQLKARLKDLPDDMKLYYLNLETGNYFMVSDIKARNGHVLID